MTEAKNVRENSIQRSDGILTRADAIVVATGSGFAPMFLPGHRKPGVHVLRSAEAYAALGRCCRSMSRPVVAGEGERALQVADRLSGEGREVRVFASGWRHGVPSPDVYETLKRGAESRGVSLAGGRVDRVAGEGSTEAVVVGGGVVACDAVVLLPDRVPRAIPIDARLGVRGGLSVDGSLRTTSPSTLAAGGCAELTAHDSRSRILDEEPGTSGRVAGANSLGLRLVFGSTARWDVAVFGLRWSVSEVGWSPECSRTPTTTVSRRWTPESACTLTFDRSSGRVLRVESVEPAVRPSYGGIPLLPFFANLASLAYGGSSDISLVSDTARVGLRLWSDS